MPQYVLKLRIELESFDDAQARQDVTPVVKQIVADLQAKRFCLEHVTLNKHGSSHNLFKND